MRTKRWDELTHSSKRAYEFRLKYIMGPLQKIAGLTPWFDTRVKDAYQQVLDQAYATWLSGASVLDIGCGPGDLSEEFVVRFGARSYIGADYAIGMARDAQRSHPHAIFLNADVSQLPFAEKSFDIVHSTRLFHHLSPDRRAAAIREQLRVARKAVILEDLFGFPSGFWRLPHRVYYTVADGSYYRYSLGEWSAMFEKMGVQVGAHFCSDQQMISNRCACWILLRTPEEPRNIPGFTHGKNRG